MAKSDIVFLRIRDVKDCSRKYTKMFKTNSFLGNKKLSFNQNVWRDHATMQHSAAASGWAGWALAHPEFGSSVNPIKTRGADYAHPITASPSRFENLAASLLIDSNLCCQPIRYSNAKKSGCVF